MQTTMQTTALQKRQVQPGAAPARSGRCLLKQAEKQKRRSTQAGALPLLYNAGFKNSQNYSQIRKIGR